MEISKKYDAETLSKLQAVLKMMLKDFITICEKYNLEYFADYGTAIGALRHKDFIPWDDDIDVGMLREDFDKFCEVLPKEMGEKYFITSPGIGSYYNMDTKLNLRDTYFALPRAPEGFKPCIFMDIFLWESCPADKNKAEKFYKKSHKLENFKYARDINLSRKDKTISGGASVQTAIKYSALKIIQKCVRLFVRSDDKFDKMYFKLIKKYKSDDDTYIAILSNKVEPNKYDDIFPTRIVDYGNFKVKLKNKVEKSLELNYGDYMQLPPEEKRWNHMVEKIDFGKYDDILNDD